MLGSLSGRRVVVMGLGRFGGGVGVTRHLVREGARVIVTDRGDESELVSSLSELASEIASGAVELALGGHRAPDFESADLVVANPAIPRPWADPYLRIATSAGVPVTTEIALTIDRIADPRRVTAVTGTVGKSTTAAMIAEAMRTTGHPVLLGGNIGGSLLDHSDQLADPDTRVVLELSSAMLHWLKVRERPWAPGVAVVTNCTPNHLDWHQTAEAYTECKSWLLAHQCPGDTAVLGEAISEWSTASGAHRVTVGEEDAIEGLACPGRHNATNGAMALAASCAAAGESIDLQAAFGAIASFPGLPHRLRLVAHEAGVRFYDDSKSSTPDATRTALRALGETSRLDRVHLICGGYDKGLDLQPLARCALELATTHAIGATGPRIAEHAATLGADRCQRHATLDEAFEAIVHQVRRDEVVLLSPGCASWDQFPDFRARGERFTQLAERWTRNHALTESQP